MGGEIFEAAGAEEDFTNEEQYPTVAEQLQGAGRGADGGAGLLAGHGGSLGSLGESAVDCSANSLF